MGESELVISLDENSGTFDVPDNTRIQCNFMNLQTHIFSMHSKKSNQFNMSANGDLIGDRPDSVAVTCDKSGSQNKSEDRSGYIADNETCLSISEEELFGEGDKQKIGLVDRKEFCDEKRNDGNDGERKDEENSQYQRRSSQQRDSKCPENNLAQMYVSSEQDTTSQRRSRFKDSKDLEVIEGSVYVEESLGSPPKAVDLQRSSGMPDIIKSSSGSSVSSVSMTQLQQQSPDVLNAGEGDVFQECRDEPDGSCRYDEKFKEKFEKKMDLEGMSHCPKGKSKPSLEKSFNETPRPKMPEESAVHFSTNKFGKHPESPADEKRDRYRSSGYGTDSKQSQNSQNSMEGSAFEGSFEKNDSGSTVINRRGGKGLGRSQIDSAFSEESGKEYECSGTAKNGSVPYLSIFYSAVTHDLPPNDSEEMLGNLPDIETLLEIENHDDESVAVIKSVIQHANDENVAVINSVRQHANDESVAVTNSVIQHANDESVAVTNSVIQHANDESVAVTNSVIQHVIEGDPNYKDLLEVQKNYCEGTSAEESSPNSFKPTLDAVEVLTQMEMKGESRTTSGELSFELPPSNKLENLQHHMALMRHDFFVNQDEINSAKYDQYLLDFLTPSPVGDYQGSPYERSPRSTPVQLADTTPQITRVDLEHASRCRDKHCEDESCKKMLEVMAYRDGDVNVVPTELICDLCKALQDHCGDCYEQKCGVLFCSNFSQWCHQSFEFEVLMRNLHCLIKEPLLFLNLRKEETKGLQFHGRLPTPPEGLVVPLVTVSSEIGSPILARVISPEHPQLLVIKEIPKILDYDQNIAVYEQLRNLTHPHIVSHYWLKEYNDNSMHIFMEFLQGGSLNEYLDTVERLPWETAVYYSRQLVKAVTFLHQHNIVYLYWDAGNVLFIDCSYSHVKLGNLSLSYPVDQQQNKFDSNGTKHSLPPHLCPPELEISSQVDRNSDSWGIGCLMIEMLMGKPVWHDKRHENKTILLKLVCIEVPAVPRHLTGEQQKFFQGCLQIDIENRWSFEQVKDFLEQPRLGRN